MGRIFVCWFIFILFRTSATLGLNFLKKGNIKITNLSDPGMCHMLVLMLQVGVFVCAVLPVVVENT